MIDLSRRRRTYNRVPNTDLGYLGFQLFEVTLIFEISEIFKNGFAETGRVHTIPDATTRSGVAPGMVSKVLTKIMRVPTFFIDRNWSLLALHLLDFRFGTDPGTPVRCALMISIGFPMQISENSENSENFKISNRFPHANSCGNGGFGITGPENMVGGNF